jgi:hypothetical protein
MNPSTLFLRGLGHHARAHAATLLGSAVGSAVLVGALAVGDSVRASLERAARERLGTIDAVIGNGQRFFDVARLGRALQERAPGARLAPVLLLDGVIASPDGRRRVDALQVLGVQPSFFELSPLDAGRASSRAMPISDRSWRAGWGRERATSSCCA